LKRLRDRAVERLKSVAPEKLAEVEAFRLERHHAFVDVIERMCAVMVPS
jgi:hypothetical protein